MCLESGLYAINFKDCNLMKEFSSGKPFVEVDDFDINLKGGGQGFSR